MKFCKRCFEFYRDNLNTKYCSKQNCAGLIIDIDEQIAPSIILLNQNGYETTHSCAGHWYEKHPAPYIKFKCDTIEQAEFYKSFFFDAPGNWYIDQATKDEFAPPYNTDEFASKQVCLRCVINKWDDMSYAEKNRWISLQNNILYDYLKKIIEQEKE